MPILKLKSYTDLIPPTTGSSTTSQSTLTRPIWPMRKTGFRMLRACISCRSGSAPAANRASSILRVRPGKQLNPHFHPTGVFGFTLSGSWRYLEHDWVATPGTFLWEPPGEAHTLVVDASALEPMVTYFVSLGGLIYIDNMQSGQPIAYDDGFTLLEIALNYYKSIGRDADALYKLCR